MGLWDEYYDYGENPNDNTFVNTTPVVSKYDGVLLTKGKYKLTIANPTGKIDNFGSYADTIDFVDYDGVFQSKRYVVSGSKYDAVNDKLIIWIEILENPIPIFVIWGAVAIAVMITGAITTDSILEDVEKIVDKPISWGIMLIFLLPVIAIFVKDMKK